MNSRFLTVVVAMVLVLGFAIAPADAAKHGKKAKSHRHHKRAAAVSNGNATISGSVRNRAGHGVAGAVVRLQHLAAHRNRVKGGGPHVRTNGAGEFTLHAPVARYAVVATKRGVGSQRAFVTPSAGSTTRLHLILSRHKGHHHHHRHKKHHPHVVTTPVPGPSNATK